MAKAKVNNSPKPEIPPWQYFLRIKAFVYEEVFGARIQAQRNDFKHYSSGGTLLPEVEEKSRKAKIIVL